MAPFLGAIGTFELYSLWLFFQGWEMNINRDAGDFFLGKQFLPKEPRRTRAAFFLVRGRRSEGREDLCFAPCGHLRARRSAVSAQKPGKIKAAQGPQDLAVSCRNVVALLFFGRNAQGVGGFGRAWRLLGVGFKGPFGGACPCAGKVGAGA